MDKNRVESYTRIGAGITGGYYAYKYGKKYLFNGAYKILLTQKAKPAQENLDIIKDAGLKFFNNYGDFKKNTIEIIDLSATDYNKFIDGKIQYVEKKWNKRIADTHFKPLQWYRKHRLKRIKEYIIQWHKKILDGKNAYFGGTDAKQVVINLKKFPEALFHELGHAQNRLAHSTLLNLRHTKGIRILPSIILGITLGTNSKSDTEKRNKIQNTAYQICSFVKNNCGKLMTLAFIPMVFEEGVASLKGQINAKKYLDKTNLKIVRNSHFMSFGSYSILAAAAGVAMTVANKLRDIIVETDIKSAKEKLSSNIHKIHQKIHN